MREGYADLGRAHNLFHALKALRQGQRSPMDYPAWEQALDEELQAHQRCIAYIAPII